jgi:predicted nucleic acid-binding protein
VVTSVERRSTATMAVESTPPELEVFLDTSLIIAATVDVHPAHQTAVSYVDKAVSGGLELCIRPQVCREFLVVLTRQPVSERVFGLDEALSALRVWTTGCRVLEENAAVLEQLLSLVQDHQVRGKQVHDCNIVATMLASGVRRLATRNAVDFKRYAGVIHVDDVCD